MVVHMERMSDYLYMYMNQYFFALDHFTLARISSMHTTPNG